MFSTRQWVLNFSTKPTLLSKIIERDTSFVDIIRSLSVEDILSLKYESGNILYYILMGLCIVCGCEDLDNDAVFKEYVKSLLSESIATSKSMLEDDQRRSLSIFTSTEEVSTLREVYNNLKIRYAAVSVKVCKTLLNVMGNDSSTKKEIDPETLEREKTASKVAMCKAVISAIEIIANKFNTAVASGKIFVQQVSNFLSCSTGSIVPDAIGIINKLYFTIEDTELNELMYKLTSVFLLSFSQYNLDTSCRTSLHYAVNMCCYRDRERFLSEIIQPIIYDAPLLALKVDKFGNSIMHYAVCSPYVNFIIVKYIHQNFPALILKKNAHGDSPLHIMASTYFIYFARVYVFFDGFSGQSLKKLRRRNSENFSELQETFSDLVAEHRALSDERGNYFKQCLEYYRFLITAVPLKYIFEERDKDGRTVYNILGSNVYHVYSGDIKTMLEDFSKVSSRLPIYDYRIDLRYKECMKSYFSGGHQTLDSRKKNFIRTFYLDARNLYGLISSKFAEISNIKAECRSIAKDRNNNFHIVCLGFAIFFALCIFNIIVVLKVDPIFGMHHGIYRSVLSFVVSVGIFVLFCVSAVVYNKFVNLEDAKFIEAGKASIEETLVSHLDIGAIDIDGKR